MGFSGFHPEAPSPLREGVSRGARSHGCNVRRFTDWGSKKGRAITDPALFSDNLIRGEPPARLCQAEFSEAQ